MTDTLPPLRVGVSSPLLARALAAALTAHDLSAIALVPPATDAGNPPDLTIEESDAPPLRLGIILDWLITRAQNRPLIALPVSLAIPTGALSLPTGLLTRHPNKGDALRLTEKERDLLIALYQAPDHRLEKGVLLAQVWGYVPGVETHTLETHIYRLRQKIERDPSQPDILRTDAGAYRLNLDEKK